MTEFSFKKICVKLTLLEDNKLIVVENNDVTVEGGAVDDPGGELDVAGYREDGSWSQVGQVVEDSSVGPEPEPRQVRGRTSLGHSDTPGALQACQEAGAHQRHLEPVGVGFVDVRIKNQNNVV